MKLRILAAAAAIFALSACGDVSGEGDANSSLQQAFSAAAQGDRVLFGFDRYDLSAEARAALDRQAVVLAGADFADVRVMIEGHTDERGTREYNLALGERRANSVHRYLASRGISASRIQTVSYGKERPEVVGSGEAAWAQNRRAVTVVMK